MTCSPLPAVVPDLPDYVRGRAAPKRLQTFDRACLEWTTWPEATKLAMWPRVCAVRLGLIEDALESLRLSAVAEYHGWALEHIQRTRADLPRGDRRHHERALERALAALTVLGGP